MYFGKKINFFLADADNPVQIDGETWNNYLPLGRKNKKGITFESLSYGDYFLEVSSFVESNDFGVITQAVYLQSGKRISSKDVNEINVFLEKHGEFYHPSRIEVVSDRKRNSFVLNVAVSAAGNRYIENEYICLNRLNNDFPFAFIPEVYGENFIGEKSKVDIRMFLGQWFEGYNEFHITCRQNKKRIIVWDPVEDHYLLSKKQTIELYHQAAYILTSYYNPETFEQIFPWHHAAGDFILKLQDDKIDLKLITVRGYSSPVEKNNIQHDPASVLEALLVFFLNLSIRIRLDRLDGVGDPAWAENVSVDGMVSGFLKALESKKNVKSIPAPLDESFYYYFSTIISEAELYGLALDIVDSYNRLSGEVSLIKQNLESHIGLLYQTICGT
ncbi:MAG: hypothetical protein HN931_02350 [Desulfobacterales bacterium]|jgi:hypothetical protein|nr:hypothetical protein [Desulfobacteraceae bacterium]MBT4363854.1 hypothetical protein [Desulfobacteraceae bacterium]MBT7084997.1 hypothetical protein [Desulfobacterales bacterium]